jgi:hypothetical protein
MDLFEAELSQGIDDQGIGRTDSITVAWNPNQRRNVEMVGMAMRDNENVDRWKAFEIDCAFGAGYDGAFLEGIVEYGIHEASGTRQFHQDRSVPEESDLHGNRPRPFRPPKAG